MQEVNSARNRAERRVQFRQKAVELGKDSGELSPVVRSFRTGHIRYMVT